MPRKYGLVGPVVCVKETDKAVCIEYGEPGYYKPINTYWIPKSQLHPDENEILHKGDTGVLVAVEWVLQEKGLL